MNPVIYYRVFLEHVAKEKSALEKIIKEFDFYKSICDKVDALVDWRGDRVGLRSAIGNRVCLKRAPWVRIPPSPLGRTLMTENREPRQSRKAATVADLQGVSGRPFFMPALCSSYVSVTVSFYIETPQKVTAVELSGA